MTSAGVTAAATPPSTLCAASPSPSTRATSSPSWARRAPASRPSCTSWPGSTSRPPGSTSIDGIALEGLRERELTKLRRDRVGFVFQAYNLLPTLSAAENVALPLRLAGRDVDGDWIAELLDTVGLADRARHRPAELSGGQQQRVAVARALATRPAIVFADEPTGNLDSRASADVLALLRSAADDRGQAIAMVTHDAVAAATADRVVFLADGAVVADEPHLGAGEILDRMKELT